MLWLCIAFPFPSMCGIANASTRVTTMHDLLLPLEMFWNWVTKNFGLPGQMLVTCAAILFVLAMFVWVGNRRGGAR